MRPTIRRSRGRFLRSENRPLANSRLDHGIPPAKSRFQISLPISDLQGQNRTMRIRGFAADAAAARRIIPRRSPTHSTNLARPAILYRIAPAGPGSDLTARPAEFGSRTLGLGGCANRIGVPPSGESASGGFIHPQSVGIDNEVGERHPSVNVAADPSRRTRNRWRGSASQAEIRRFVATGLSPASASA